MINFNVSVFHFKSYEKETRSEFEQSGPKIITLNIEMNPEEIGVNVPQSHKEKYVNPERIVD